jgi:hypothetical protein
MPDQLIRLTRMDASGSFSKEDLFNWIVDLDQQEFDDLCNQIIALYRFQQTYEGALVSDEEDLLKPWLPVLPRIVFAVEPAGSRYQKKYFYQFLTDVKQDELTSMCEEILSLYSHARENDHTYIISQVYPAVAGMVESWRVHYKKPKQFSDLPRRITNWQEMLLFRQ